MCRWSDWAREAAVTWIVHAQLDFIEIEYDETGMFSGAIVDNIMQCRYSTQILLGPFCRTIIEDKSL